MEKTISRYIAEVDEVYRSGNATEHSYRPALKILLEALTSGLDITNEPKRIACGAPDFIVTRDALPLGYIEAKDIAVGIRQKKDTEQFARYKQSLGNLIITDYLTFELFAEGGLVASVTIARENSGGIFPDEKQFSYFLALLEKFTMYSGKTIHSAEALAEVMAAKAKLLAEVVKTAVQRPEKDSLAEQYEGFKTVLLHSLGAAEFADMYAQTLAYGFFAARLNQRDNQRFTRKTAAESIPKSNPFLRKFFQYIAGYDLDTRIAWIVDALADIFNSVSAEDILKEFEKANQDPYIHFYETFLAEYNPALRESRGVYYTPLPAVKFIVQAVDDLLIEEFGLKTGLADYSKVTRSGKDKDGKPKTEELHRVQILDPAAGTGTFLAEVIEKVFSRFARNKGMWQDYCEKNLIPRLHGFEILMASYAMAHFKLDMKLRETGFSFKDSADAPGRLRIFLTNSLEEPENVASNFPLIKWLTDEANEANKIKRDTPVMVVLGNPPYSGESANITGGGFLSPYKKEPGGVEKLKERNSKWINDDYIKFIRYGQRFIEKLGDGVLAYINNHAFLDNPTFRGMRWHLLHTFDRIYILDLHGNSKKKETAPDDGKDENIFDIQQGVSINIFLKTGKKKESALAEVFHYDLYGKREAKYAFLLENTLSTVQWRQLKPSAPQYFFVQKNFFGKDEYDKGFSIQELFPVNGVGITTAHDDFVISENRTELLKRFTEFKKSRGETAYLHEKFKVKYKDGWDILKGWNNLQKTDDVSAYIQEIQYRPFDKRYIFYEDALVWRTVKKIMRHFLAGENIGLVFSKKCAGDWRHVFISDTISEFNLTGIAGSLGSGYLFPLYLYPEGLHSAEARRPNLNADIVQAISEKTGLLFTVEKEADSGTFAPLDLLDYIYAVLYSNVYRKKYAEFLKIDFPRVPYPAGAEQFRDLADFGGALRRTHLLEGVEPAEGIADFPIPGTNEVETLSYKDEKVYINKKQYFENVPPDVYEYYIGGYQPAQKWLKDRRGVSLSFDDIQHYRRIVTALKTALELQARASTRYSAFFISRGMEKAGTDNA